MKSIRSSRLLLVGMVVLVIVMPAGAVYAKPPDKLVLELAWDQPFWDCGDFLIYEKSDVRLVVMSFYDGDGNFRGGMDHWSLDGGLYRYPDEDSFLPYVPAHEKAIYNEFGEPTAVVGLFAKVIIPGEGPIFHDVGRVEFDSDFNLIFSAGRHDFWEGNGDALCEALRGP